MRRLLTSFLLTLILTGCSGNTSSVGGALSPSNAPAQTTLQGIVQSGGTSQTRALANATVTLWEAGSGAPTSLASAVSDQTGRFTLSTSRTTTPGVFYATADLHPGLRLAASLGQKLPSSFTLNELTTVASAYAFSQLMQNSALSGSPLALKVAAGMNDNLVSVSGGTSSSVLQNSPNADETNSLRSTRSLANLLAGCLQDPTQAINFLTLTTPTGGTAPQDLWQALSNLNHDPSRNVSALYAQSQQVQPYQPALQSQPDAWTLCVKVNNSGNDSMMFGGPANVAFDSQGFVWIANNVNQGSTVSGNYCIVLQPNGQPATGLNGNPPSPLTGGGLLGCGFGVTIDRTANVWFGNFGWGGANPTPTGQGSLCEFTATGQPLSPSTAFQGGVVRAQGIAFDASNNLWAASYGNDQVVVLLGGDPTRSVFFQEPANSQPFGVAIAKDGTAWVTDSGGFLGDGPTAVSHYQLSGGALTQLSRTPLGKANKAIVLDSLGNVWASSQGDNTVYFLTPDGTIRGRFQGGGVNGPWGINVDSQDHIWVGNFGPLQPGSDLTNASVSRLCGANPATQPPGKKTGDPLSPSTGYTLPSAGSQVLLHNGTPLYGPNGPACFAPLMRQTSVNIDAAGNLWAANNWKPNFDIDVASNPGGDGMVIFVGLAPPR